MRNVLLPGAVSFAAIFCWATAISGQSQRAPVEARNQPTGQRSPAPKEESVTSEHRIRIAGQTIPYKATAGSLLIRHPQGDPAALIYYVAYVRSDVADASRRPLSFLYNGGPGSSSIYIHMGAFGPRQIVTAEANPTEPAPTAPPPYAIVDNPYCLLDASDLVFIDPVGTGFSHAVGKSKNRDFWGVDEDVDSLAQFVYSYVSRNHRWNSPKYLIGESYGTFRSVALGNYLQSHDGTYLNGIVLMSSVLNLHDITFRPGDDIPYILYIPSYAATAWYHRMLRPELPDLKAFLQQASRFALTTYAEALLKGSQLSEAEKAGVAEQMSHFTGLSESYILQADLRVNLRQFMAELQRSRGMATGRADSRFSGQIVDPLAEYAPYDPQQTEVNGAFTAAVNEYLRDELKFNPEMTYQVAANDAVREWDWKHAGQGFGFPGAPNVIQDLVGALVTNPDLRIEIENGYYDLATPFFETEYEMTHLGLPASLQSHVQLKFYESGHMMYVHQPSHAQLKANVASFIERTSKR